MLNEFSFIQRLLAPLAQKEAGAFSLSDDGAGLSITNGEELILTKDALVEGVHFIGDEDPGLIARKALRVNLSDCAAMGAAPRAYLLALMLSETTNDAFLTRFAEGLREDQEAFGITLLGGDTTRSHGPLSLSVTLLGTLPGGTALRRNGAKPGDLIYVSGTIGDGALGLAIAREGLNVEAKLPANDYLLRRYRLPEPRISLGIALRHLASSCMDISDGLVQDLEHICTASGTGAEIHWPLIPLSDAARTLAFSDAETVLTGGDDYELLFTVPAAQEDKVKALQDFVPVTRIGKITQGREVRVLHGRNELNLTRKGYRHF